MNRASIKSGRQSSAHEAPDESGKSKRFWRTKWAVISLALLVAGLAFLVNARPFPKLLEPADAARDAVIRGQELLKHGRARQALAAISGIREDGPWKADLLTIRGLALATLGEVEPSRLALESSLAIQPMQPMAAKVLSAIYFSRREDVRGIELLDRAAAIDPGDFRPWYAMGDAFVRLGQPEEAATSFRHALERKPTHVESRIGLLTALLVTRPPEESADLLRELLQARPDDPKVQVLAAWHARALGQSDRALEHAEKAVELDPNLLEAIVIRAQLNHVAGKSRLALADAERAVELDPNNLPGLNLLAQLQASMGQTEIARATFARHRKVLERSELIRKLSLELEKRPNDPEPRWKLGQVAAEGGITNLAISSFEAALALDPRCRPAIEGLRALGPEVRKSGISVPQPSSLSWSIRP